MARFGALRTRLYFPRLVLSVDHILAPLTIDIPAREPQGIQYNHSIIKNTCSNAHYIIRTESIVISGISRTQK